MRAEDDGADDTRREPPGPKAMSLPVVEGFRWAGVEAGIKKRGGLDLALLVADAPVAAAAVLTRNVVHAAPVAVTRSHVSKGRAQVVLVNSGCANACTGAAGMRATMRTVRCAADLLRVTPQFVLPASTGVIGVLLPADRIEAALPAAIAALRPEGAADFARAIMTTDRGPKTAFARVRLGGRRVTIAGVAKGAGMIHPSMATTLAHVVTDAAVASPTLRALLREATDDTFNRASVDGDTSTNDTITLLASGRASNAVVRGGRDAATLLGALRAVLDHLARMIVADGEGSRHLVTVRVTHARSDADARAAASAIATSPLVKTAIHGCDPNWGRLLAAAGRSGARFDPDRAGVWVGDVRIVRRGVLAGGDVESRAHAIMQRPEYEIRVDLGAGPGQAHHYACDLGHAYVSLNADYRS